MKKFVHSCCLLVMLSLTATCCWAQTSNAIPTSTAAADGNKPELVVQLGQGSSVDEAIFSPEGSSILTANFGPSGSAVLWDVASAAELRTFNGGSEELKAIGLSHDGRHVLTGSYDGVARLWNAATGEQIRSFRGG